MKETLRTTACALLVVFATAALGVCLTVTVRGEADAQREDSEAVRFEAWDVSIGSKDRALAAYQFEFSDPSGRSLVAGVEGGEHSAFRDAPYYDSAALSKERLVVAAFDTGDELPTGKAGWRAFIYRLPARESRISR